MIFQNIEEDIEKIPSSSGIYYFYDKDEKLLYLGKAKKLKTRIFEHLTNYNIHRESMYYQSIAKSKRYLTENDWDEDFRAAIRDFQFRAMWKQEPLVIDLIFGRVKKIKIEEVPFDQIKEKEKEQIEKLHPPFNYETANDEYFQVRDNLN